ncbi:MAG: hypothetical protein PHW62_00790 [Candidatus Ratteibacteria bacterium]|nr:hypothetical protein [Candidatus Ratteibacteria bacterium]
MRNLKPLRIVKLNTTGELGQLIEEAKCMGGLTHFLAAGTGNYLLNNLPVVTEKDISETALPEKIIYLKLELGKYRSINDFIINNGEYIILEVPHDIASEPHPYHIFHTYINFMDTGKGYASLDSALIGLLAYKYQGTNSQAGEMFERMLEMNKKNTEISETGDGKDGTN